MKMVHIHDQAPHPSLMEYLKDVGQKGPITHGEQGFGQLVREGPKPRPEAS